MVFNHLRDWKGTKGYLVQSIAKKDHPSHESANSNMPWAAWAFGQKGVCRVSELHKSGKEYVAGESKKPRALSQSDLGKHPFLRTIKIVKLLVSAELTHE